MQTTAMTCSVQSRHLLRRNKYMRLTIVVKGNVEYWQGVRNLPRVLPSVWFPPESIMKRLNAKTDISIFINLRYLRLKLLKNKENNKKICNIFIITAKIFLVIWWVRYHWQGFILLYLMMDLLLKIWNWRLSVFEFELFI